MIICLFLDSNNTRRHLSLSEKSFYSIKDAATTHLQFQKTNMKNFQQTVLKCQPSSNKELLKALFLTSETNQRQ